MPPDNAIGRYLADTVASVPRVNSDAFDKLFNDSVQVCFFPLSCLSLHLLYKSVDLVIPPLQLVYLPVTSSLPADYIIACSFTDHLIISCVHIKF